MTRTVSFTFDDGEVFTFTGHAFPVFNFLDLVFSCESVAQCEKVWTVWRNASPLKQASTLPVDTATLQQALTVLWWRTGHSAFQYARMALSEIEVSGEGTVLNEDLVRFVQDMVFCTIRRGGSERLGLARAAAAVPIDANGGNFTAAIAKARRVLQSAPPRS